MPSVNEKGMKNSQMWLAIRGIGAILCIVARRQPFKSTHKQRRLKMGFDTYISDFTNGQVLSNEQVVALHNLLKKGLESAREQLVRGNMKLVLKIANDYRNYGMDFEDIVSNGVLGLLKAIEVFDATKGDFSPCASVWIKKYIRMGFDTGRSVHTNRYDRMTEEERSSCIVESLNEKVGDGETEIADRLAGNLPTPSEAVEKASSLDALRDAINALDAREQVIVRSRYGLDGHRELTLEQLASKLNCTRERVRQLEVLACRKLRRRLER